MSRHAVSFLTIKTLDADQRIIEGWATKPELDRQGDIVEPMGMKLGAQMPPLLLDHDHRSAVGTVEDLRPTVDGVRFRARLAKIATPGPVKDLVDGAWEMCRSGLRRALSIGFLPDSDHSDPLPSGGRRFRKWAILELSLVSVPACAGATIDTVKSFDQRKRRKGVVVRLNDPVRGASGKSLPVVRLDGTPVLKSSGDARPVAEAMLKAVEDEQRFLEEIKSRKALGSQALHSSMITAGAKAADATFAELIARLERLERYK